MLPRVLKKAILQQCLSPFIQSEYIVKYYLQILVQYDIPFNCVVYVNDQLWLAGYVEPMEDR